MHESVGKRRPVSPRHGNKWLTAMLVEAAGSVGRMKGANCLAAHHARLTARRGMSRAAVAVAHPGDWLLRADDGSRWSVAGEVFRRTYLPVETDERA